MVIKNESTWIMLQFKYIIKKEEKKNRQETFRKVVNGIIMYERGNQKVILYGGLLSRSCQK